MDHDHYSDAYISQILHSVRTIALVGASPKGVRPSNIVVKYLVAKGYCVFPINPGHAGKQIHGRTIYASLADVPEPIDMVEIFRGSSYMPSIVEEALALKVRPKVIWAQLTVRHDEAARIAEAAGLKVVMNRCPKIEFGRLSGEIGWNGINSRVISAKLPIRGPGLQTLTIRPRG